jgi:hypothetical protein
VCKHPSPQACNEEQVASVSRQRCDQTDGVIELGVHVSQDRKESGNEERDVQHDNNWGEQVVREGRLNSASPKIKPVSSSPFLTDPNNLTDDVVRVNREMKVCRTYLSVKTFRSIW